MGGDHAPHVEVEGAVALGDVGLGREAETSQHFLSAGAAWRGALGEKLDWSIYGGLLFVSYRERALDEKVTGSATFGIDVRVPGMLFATVVHPPVFGGSVASFDAAKARAVPGVKDVVQITSGVAVATTAGACTVSGTICRGAAVWIGF